MPTDDSPTSTFAPLRPRLRRIAYRMLWTSTRWPGIVTLYVTRSPDKLRALLQSLREDTPS